MSEEFTIAVARPISGGLAHRVATTREPLLLTDHERAVAILESLPPRLRAERH
jgi:hypothetical protein